jgi:hypothetical protein
VKSSGSVLFLLARANVAGRVPRIERGGEWHRFTKMTSDAVSAPYMQFLDCGLMGGRAGMLLLPLVGDPLRQGAGKSFWTLPIFGSTAAVDRDVFWKSDRVLRFFPSGGLYR